MARFLVIGALAWDVPARLAQPLARGGRFAGVLAAGRLGGGGANAGVALRRAGHDVALAGPLRDDDTGAAIRDAAKAAGLDLALCDALPGPTPQTLILQDPDGERAILSLRHEGAAPLESYALRADAAIDYAAGGLYVRAGFPGAAQIAQAQAGPVVAHWPLAMAGVSADIAIGSRDDLPADVLHAPFTSARDVFGPRLRCVIITAGAEGAVAYEGSKQWRQPALPVEIIDTTGAGDVFAAGVLEAICAGGTIADAMLHGARWAKAAIGAQRFLDGEFPAFATA
jgi:sugar/nucleoside kinase (ribokinase family)